MRRGLLDSAKVGWTRRRWLTLPLAPALLSGAEATTEEFRLDCKARYFDPELDFEFRFYHGYEIEIPVRQLAGPARPIVFRLRVYPLDIEGAEPTVFERRANLGEIRNSTRGRLELESAFVTGPGRYQAVWEFRDAGGKFCSATWEVEAKRSKRYRDVTFSLAPGEVADSRSRIFRRERVEKNAGDGRPPLRIKALVNFDPYRRRRPQASVRLYEFVPRLAALRALSRHPRIGRVAMTAFSIQEQKVLVRHGLDDAFDYPALRRAMDKLSPALVDISQLGEDADKEFFSEMLLDELDSDEPIDAYVFLGPDGEVGRRTPRETTDALEPVVQAPILYLNSSPRPWRGLVGSAVKRLDGKEFRFRSPTDLAEAVEKAIARIDES